MVYMYIHSLIVIDCTFTSLFRLPGAAGPQQWNTQAPGSFDQQTQVNQ